MAAFVAKHLYRRAISDTVVASEIEACGSCGFVFSDAMFTALGGAETFYCPSCGTVSSTGNATDDVEETVEPTDVRGLSAPQTMKLLEWRHESPCRARTRSTSSTSSSPTAQ